MEFSGAARWIWLAGEATPRNFWLLARRAFTCPARPRQATLLITADSRYEVSIDGVRLGTGPVRSFPWAYSYDQYDLTPYLRTGGEHVLSARVTQWGEGTMQSIPGRGGFLCEVAMVDQSGRETRVTGSDGWRVREDTAFARRTPRIATQLPFEEHYDAREEPVGWRELDYDDADWQHPIEVGPVGCPPWTTLEARTIPFLGLDPIAPIRVLAAEVAQPRIGAWWSMDLHHLSGASVPLYNADPPGEMQHAIATEIIVDSPCEVTVWFTWSGRAGNLWLRGAPALDRHAPTARDHAEVRLRLEAGPNLLVLPTNQRPVLHVEHEGALRFSADRLLPDGEGSGAAWAYIGPLDERTDLLDRICRSVSAADLPPEPRRVAIPASEALLDVFALTASQRFHAVEGGFCAPEIDGPTPRPKLGGERPRPLVHQEALLHRNGEWATVEPQLDGDVHLVVDFGREVVGFLEFSLDAPAGTIVDAVCFEGIDQTGIFWTWGLHNSFRYTAREGEQRFRSHVRRGFRYVSLTFRNHSEPIRIGGLRCLLNTYPVEERGRFRCSDALLTRIWEIAAYTVRLCMEDTYVDCPAYEQVFWVGDARNSALVNAVAFGAFALTDRCLRLTGQSLSRELDAIKPPRLRERPHLTTDHVVSSWFSEIPMWTFLWVWNVWEQYWLTGDRDALADHYPAVRECLERAWGFLSDRRLFAIPDVWNLLDWAATDMGRHGEVTANTAMLASALRHAASMAEVLGHIEEGARFTEQANQLREAINLHCWDNERQAYVDTVRDAHAYELYRAQVERDGNPVDPMLRVAGPIDTPERFAARRRISEPTNTLVMLCECAPPERAALIAPLVLAAREGAFVSSSPWAAESWPADRIVPVGSPWFLFFTLETLIAMGRTEVALSVLREQWSRMVEKGATTFWETFPGQVGAGHWSRSLCHGWSAAPAYFLSTLVLGVRPLAPGYARVGIAPTPPDGLTWADGVVPSPRGDITVAWQRTGEHGDGWSLNAVLPAQSSGEVTLPGGRADRPPSVSGHGGGDIVWTGDGWRVVLAAGARVTITLAGETG